MRCGMGGSIAGVHFRGKVMMQRILQWPRLLPAARLSLLSLPLLALPSFPAPVQAQSALKLFEGSWSDLRYGCDLPWRITVSGDTIRFEVPVRESPETPYYSTEEKILGVKDNVIDTVIASKTDNDIFDNVGDRFTYTVEADRFLNHVHRNDKDYIHTRCHGRPVADRGSVPRRAEANAVKSGDPDRKSRSA
jgi:hypothetical protein